MESGKSFKLSICQMKVAKLKYSLRIRYYYSTNTQGGYSQLFFPLYCKQTRAPLAHVNHIALSLFGLLSAFSSGKSIYFKLGLPNNPLLNDKFWDGAKFKAFADNKSKIARIMIDLIVVSLIEKRTV